MATRTVLIPAYYDPSGLNAVAVVVRFDLVDATGRRQVVGYESSQGILSSADVTVDGTESSIDLAVSEDINPAGTQWRVKVLVAEKVIAMHLITLAAGEPVSLDELI